MRYGGFSKIRYGNVKEGFISAPNEPQKFVATLQAVRIEDENACCLATTEHTGTKLLSISMGFDEEVSLKERVSQLGDWKFSLILLFFSFSCCSWSFSAAQRIPMNTPRGTRLWKLGSRVTECDLGSTATMVTAPFQAQQRG